MAILLLKSLVEGITSLFQLSSFEAIKCKPVNKHHQMVEEMLKLLKPILDAIVDAEIASDEMLQTEFARLKQSLDDLREIFENWQPLMSKVYIVLQVNSLTAKIRNHGLESLELLKSSDQCLPAELNAASLELCVQRIKHMESELTSLIMLKAIKDQVEGSGASSDSLAHVADELSLKSNLELLIEAVALGKLKENAEQAENIGEIEYIDQMIALVTRMHDLFVMMKQSQTCNPFPIPADFCCPLSLELMTDPVIVSSGQTYERAFIQKWIDLGLTVCPKTRQSLVHTNFIPNYIVKALLENWCESKNVKLPDPTKSINSPLASAQSVGVRRVNSSDTSDPRLGSPIKRSISSRANHRQGTSPSHPCSLSEDSLTEAAINGNMLDTERVSPRSSDDRLESNNSGERRLRSGGLHFTSPSRYGATGADEPLSRGHSRTNSASSTVSNSRSTLLQGAAVDGNEGASQDDDYASEASEELAMEQQPPANPSSTQREPDFPSRPEATSRGQPLPSERFFPRVVSSPAVEMGAELLEVETQVKKLVESLKSSSLDEQRDATSETRLLARHYINNRIIIANLGTIPLLVNLLYSTDRMVQENAVTALLNLSINHNNKSAIANADAIEPLMHVLETGSAEAKENSAATLGSLSVIDENKIKIGRSGAIKPLADLLGDGTPRGKKDAVTALFYLSINHENKARVVHAGAVKYLVELMDPAFGMVDKAVAVLANLATIPEGRTAIGLEGGIPVLVEVAELGSGRGKENATAALLQLCTNSSRFCNVVLQEGAVPPLTTLLLSGTPRAREKAHALLVYFRNHRHSNSHGG